MTSNDDAAADRSDPDQNPAQDGEEASEEQAPEQPSSDHESSDDEGLESDITGSAEEFQETVRLIKEGGVVPESLGTGPIPRELYLSYEDHPPRVCLVCQADLQEGRLYQIQKVFQRDEVVLEMSVCRRCCDDLSREFSQESLETIRSFVTRVAMAATSEHGCRVCGADPETFQSRVVVGMCQRDSIIGPPIVVCEPCNMGLEEKLSKKTRDVHGEFVRDHFPGVPADLDPSPVTSII